MALTPALGNKEQCEDATEDPPPACPAPQGLLGLGITVEMADAVLLRVRF